MWRKAKVLWWSSTFICPQKNFERHSNWALCPECQAVHLSVPPSVRPTSCLWCIFHNIIWDRNPKFCLQMHLGMRSVTYYFWVILTLTYDLISRIMSGAISPTLFEEGIPNSVWIHLGMTGCLIPCLSHCWPWPLTTFLELNMSKSYVLQTWGQLLWKSN